MQRLKDEAEKAKIALSNSTTVNISIPYITADATGPKHLNVTLSRAKFNDLTSDLVEMTMGPLKQAISDSGLDKKDIHKILLVGGSTRIPAVQDAVKSFLGKDPFKGINPDECVAIGASIQGGVLNKEVQGIVLLDVAPLSLGIETAGGICTRMIERNTTIPTKETKVFTTYADNQPSVDINVLQGEREFARDNKSIGNFRLDGIAPAPRGIPQIEVTFDIDANGIVNVTAKDKGTGKEQHISITASTNMSKEDIDKAVREAEAYAAEDKKRKEDVDARNEADSMVYQIKKSMNDFGDKVSADDKAKVEPKIIALEEALKGTDIEAVKKAKEELQTAFYEVAQKVYQADPNAAAAAGADVSGAAEAASDNNGGSNDDGAVDVEFTEK